MRISIWYEYTDAPYGGSNNFLRRLGQFLQIEGHTVVYGFTSECDVVLLNAFVCAPGRYLRLSKVAQVWSQGKINFLSRMPGAVNLFRRLPRYGKPIIHRVDGVTSLYGRKTPWVDDLTVAINRFADVTVFQSQYCETSFRNYGMNPNKSIVINNGVPLETFYPSKNTHPIDSKMRFIAVSWSSNPMKGFATLAKFSEIPYVSVSFIGNWPNGVPSNAVQILGARTETEIATLLREHDAFVHFAENEPSSNAIIEALASGLPVLYRDSGGNAELVKDCGLPLQGSLNESVERFVSEYQLLRERTIEQRFRFSIDHAAHQYLGALEEACSMFA